MYVTSKRKNTKSWQDDKLSWDWDAMGSGDKEEPATPAPRPKTSFFDLNRTSQTPRTLGGDGQKRSGGGFHMPAYGSHAKRVKLEHTSPEPTSFRATNTPDAKPAIKPTKTPAAPKKKPAGPFIVDDSDEEPDHDTAAGEPKSAAPTPTSPALPEPQHTPTPPPRVAARNSMPATRQEQRAESKRLREEALARRYGSPAMTVKVETPADRAPPHPSTPISKAEPIDLTGDTPSPPAFNGRQSSRPVPENSRAGVPEKLKAVIPEKPNAVSPETSKPIATETPKAIASEEPKADVPPNTSGKQASAELRPQQFQERQISKVVAGDTPQANGLPFQAVNSKALKATLQPPKAATTLKPQEVLPIPTPSKKHTAFDVLRAQLRQSELKREEELKQAEAARAAALTRDEIADRRRAEQEQQRKQRLVEDARKKAAARQQAIEQAQREADSRRQLEKQVEQPVAQLEKERKKQQDEQNRIFTEKRKAEKEAQERFRQQQLEKQKDTERAKQQKLREERIRKLQERNAQLQQQDNTEDNVVEEQRAALPAPVSLSQMAKDAARGAAGAVNTNEALESSPAMQPRSLHSLRPGELSKLEASVKQDQAGSLAEISQVDLIIVQMRSLQNLDWAAIAHYNESATGQAKSESTLRRRYRTVENALEKHSISAELTKRARDGDEAARAEINQRVNGQQPIPPGGATLRAEPQPVLRLGRQHAGPVPANTARLEALPNAAVSPYRNVANTAGRHDSATESRQNVGGKTIDENFFFHMLEQNHRAFVEMDEESEPDDSQEDRFYYTYSFKRRELPDGSDPEDTDTWPVTRSDDTFETLEEANAAASQDIYRLSEYEGKPFPDISAGYNFASAVDDETGMLSFELQTGDGGIVQVEVERELHVRRDQAQKLPPATISRTVYHVMQRVTTKEVVDAVLGTEKEIVKESLVGNASHTDRDQANEIAIRHFVHANYSFGGGSPNLSRRTEVCKPKIEALKDSLLVEQLFSSDSREAQVEVWVQEGKVAGPRNL